MHFTSSNLLHNFLNDKYMLFSLYKKNHVKNMGQFDLTHNPIDLNLFLTRLKWPVLTCNPIDPPNPNPPHPAPPVCHVYLLNWDLPIRLEPSSLTPNATTATSDLLSPNRTHDQNLTVLFFSALGCDYFWFLDLV